MARLSGGALRILGPDFIQGITVHDAYAPLTAVIDEGWMLEDDAVLLAAFKDSYFGERSRFADTTGYEMAVNGRAIPDLDLEETGDERVRRLIRRGTAFAWQALYAANRSLPGKSLVAVVSAAPILMDPDVYTGNVTFHAVPPEHEAGAALAKDEDVVVLLESRECTVPLPHQEIA